jgi:hypothetical protein
VLYARAQLKLQYIVMLDEGGVLEELMGLVEKELDQTGIAVAGLHHYGFDGGREEKLGSLSWSGRGFLELAAATLYEVPLHCLITSSSAAFVHSRPCASSVFLCL